MTKNNTAPSAYLKFLNLVQALKAIPTFPTMDSTEERPLHQLASAWNTGKQITVLEAMQLETDTAPTTIHRRLKSLREKGIIELTTDEIDNRIKYVFPTPLAAKYFAQLNQALTKASK